MKVLITGCNGQLGLELIRQFKKFGNEFIIVETNIHNLDISNRSEVFQLVDLEKPNVIINCAAFTNVDLCESEEVKAFKINAIGAQNLSAAAYKAGAAIMQVSTDYVFDGRSNNPIRETHPINPINFYGKSKALGEVLVRETNPRHYIVRTAWLYGEGNNFVTTMLKMANEYKEIEVVQDQIGSPTSTVDLAACMIPLLETESYGTYHATCGGSCSWHEFAVKIFELKGLDKKVRPITTEQLQRPAARPKYSVLDNFMLKLINLNTFRHWDEALKEYLNGKE